MTLHLPLTYAPMEAASVDRIPEGGEWQYEPKWDGFRCLAFRDGDRVELQSKAGQPLARYFPEVAAALLKSKAQQFVVDGELAIEVDGQLCFDELLLRLHPAASRVKKLAEQHPAMFIVFDLLEQPAGEIVADHPLAIRRPLLETFVRRFLPSIAHLSPATTEIGTARGWLKEVGANMDGIVAKRLDLAYQSGERTGMQKIKLFRTVDCVVGGFRYGIGKKVVGSLLLGLFDPRDGLLHHVGFTSSIKAAEREALTQKLERLRAPVSFTGRAPGGPSRWRKQGSSDWEAVSPELVVEVTYDHFTGGRFRHGTKLERWRPDKSPEQCTLRQLETGGGGPIQLLRE